MTTDPAAQELARKARKVIGLQLVIGALIAAGFLLGKGPWEAYSAAYGGMVSIISALQLSRGVIKASSQAQAGVSTGQATLYLGAAVRFIMVLALLGIGLAIVRFEGVPVVIGFALTQLAFLIMMNRRG